MTNLAYEHSAEPPPKKRSDAQIIELVRLPPISLHAFCDTPEMIATMEAAVADRRLSRVHARVHTGGIAAAIELYRGTASPNLIIIESRATTVDLHTQLDALADVCQASTKAMVIGYANDVALYRDLVVRGVAEYIVAPVSPMAIVAAVSRLYQHAGAKKQGQSFAFVGAKGGVASSTVANNVASTIARTRGRDVILADLDLPFGSTNLDFNFDPTPGFAQALADPARLDDVLLERLLTKCADHLRVLSAPAVLGQSRELEETAVAQMIEIAQAIVPFVVLNVPHLWTSWAKQTLLVADEVVVTAAPDLTSLRNAKTLVDLLKKARPNDAPPRLVLNQVGMPKRTEIKPQKFAESMGMDLTACIPFEPATFSTAASHGRMISDRRASAAVRTSFAKIAETIAGSAPEKAGRKRRFAFTSLWGG
jgi:pilus assembly protein CpaE